MLFMAAKPHYPGIVRGAADPPMKQPFVLNILAWLAAFGSAAMYLSILLALLGIGPTIMGGERVTRSEWLHIAAPLVAVVGLLMAFISYGLFARKPWPRHLAIAIFALIFGYAAVLGAFSLIHRGIMWRAIINASIFGCVTLWYFYFKPNVAAYFRALSKRR